MYTKEITIYEYAELNNEAKERANQWYCETLDYEWWDAVYYDAKTIAALMGIDIDNIYFSGFACQGDGACFEGEYRYKKGGLKAVKQYAPMDDELHRIAKGLQEIQRRYFYGLSAVVRHSGRYYHSYSTSVTVAHDNYCHYSWIELEDAEKEISDLLRDFMCWIFDQLESEFDYLTSEEAIAESMEANGYTFDEYGNRED